MDAKFRELMTERQEFAIDALEDAVADVVKFMPTSKPSLLRPAWELYRRLFDVESEESDD